MLYGPAISQSDCRKAGPYQLLCNNYKKQHLYFWLISFLYLGTVAVTHCSNYKIGQSQIGQSLIYKTENLLDITYDNFNCPLFAKYSVAYSRYGFAHFVKQSSACLTNYSFSHSVTYSFSQFAIYSFLIT